MKLPLTALTVAASLIASGASAYDSKTLEVLENLSKVTIGDLQARILGAAEGTLEEKNERRERLRSAQEDWENHPKAEIDLSSAKLSNAYLPDIKLIGADLSGADLNDAGLSGAILRKADLSGANLRKAHLIGADLSGADLSDADLSGADLTNANLKRATMKGVILCNTTMPDGSVIYSGC